MIEHCVFYQGWTKNSIAMEKFLKERGIPYTLVYQEMPEKGKIFLPGNEDPYYENNFDYLKSRILSERKSN